MGWITAVACSTAGDDQSTSEDALNVDGLSEDALAKKALQILGAAQTPPEAGNQASCSNAGCHNINRVTLTQWKAQYRDAVARLNDTATANLEKINFMRQNPGHAETEFTPERIGIMAAGVHLGTTAQVSPTLHKRALAQGKMIEKVFSRRPEVLVDFRAKMLMPVLPQYPRLTPTQFEVILKWFDDGLPKMEEIIVEDRPTTCTDSFEGLKAHASAVKNDNWTAKNKSRRMLNFACAPNVANATECFTQKRNGKDIFDKSEDQDFSKGWALEGSTVRVLRDFSAPNSYWMRTSSDGRFVASGGGRNGGAQAMDLKATLEGAARRDIGLDASYDPDFFPDNNAFMFQGGTKFCSQSLLEKPETTRVTFGEPECSSLSSADGLYQTVGQVIGDNSLGDRFILYSTWQGDSGSYSATARDTQSRAGESSNVKIFTAVADGNDGKYKVSENVKTFPTPYLGDTMMGRSGRIIGSRASGISGNLGYQIDSILESRPDGSYTFRAERQKLGMICIKGNKANLSFDERFLTTHHYNEPADYEPTDPQAAGFREKGSSDIYVVDFVTGKKVRVAKLNPGQFGLYPHFRSDGWLYFLVVDNNTDKYYAVASDWAVRAAEGTPTP